MKKTNILIILAVVIFLLSLWYVSQNNHSESDPVELSAVESWTHEILPDSAMGDPRSRYCNQSATTTDCSKPPKQPETSEPVVTPEPPLLDDSLSDDHLTINNELTEVNFCGNTYQARQVLIDGVNVVQRIGEILAEKDEGVAVEYRWCFGISDSKYIYVEDVSAYEVEKTGYDPVVVGIDSYIYNMFLEGYSFDVVLATNSLNQISRYDGSVVGSPNKFR